MRGDLGRGAISGARRRQSLQPGRVGIVLCHPVRPGFGEEPGAWFHPFVQNPQNHDLVAALRPVYDREVEDVGGTVLPPARKRDVERAHSGGKIRSVPRGCTRRGLRHQGDRPVEQRGVGLDLTETERAKRLLEKMRDVVVGPACEPMTHVRMSG